MANSSNQSVSLKFANPVQKLPEYLEKKELERDNIVGDSIIRDSIIGNKCVAHFCRGLC